jgi:hypothetical protein
MESLHKQRKDMYVIYVCVCSLEFSLFTGIAGGCLALIKQPGEEQVPLPVADFIAKLYGRDTFKKIVFFWEAFCAMAFS